MRVLVTGGAGYIGSHAALALRRRGHEVLLYDNLCTGHALLAKDFEFVRGDVSDSSKLAPLLSRVEALCTLPPTPMWANRW